MKMIINVYKENLNNINWEWSHMDRFVIGGHSSLFKGLAKSGMGMASPGNIFTAGAIFHSQDSFCNHFACIGADYVDA